jgi:hypothetical protein
LVILIKDGTELLNEDGTELLIEDGIDLFVELVIEDGIELLNEDGIELVIDIGTVLFVKLLIEDGIDLFVELVIEDDTELRFETKTLCFSAYKESMIALNDLSIFLLGFRIEMDFELVIEDGTVLFIKLLIDNGTELYVKLLINNGIELLNEDGIELVIEDGIELFVELLFEDGTELRFETKTLCFSAYKESMIALNDLSIFLLGSCIEIDLRIEDSTELLALFCSRIIASYLLKDDVAAFAK